VDVLTHRRHVFVVQIEARHSLVLPGAAHNRRDGFAVLIAQGGEGTEKTRTTLVTAPKVRAVAGGAIHAVDRLTSRHHLGGSDWARLLREIRPPASTSAPTSAATSTTSRTATRLFGRLCPSQA
jgi:hypothetical protein